MTFTIKEISELTGLSVPTLRYYEQIGLLDPVDRAANGHRRYTEDDLNRIEFLKRMRTTGMSIMMIQHYVQLYREGDSTISQRRQILEAHRRAIMAQMQDLQQTLEFIDYKLNLYRKHNEGAHNAKESSKES